MIKILIELHSGEYQAPTFGAEEINAAQFGAFCAIIRHRSYPEFIHKDQVVKKPGRRQKRTEADRIENSTSHRLHFPVLPKEWGILLFCLPDADNYRPCCVRVTFGAAKAKALVKMGLRPDDENTAFPDNEDNPVLERALLKAIERADALLPKGTMTAAAAYRQASSTGFSGVMSLAAAKVVLPKETDEGFVYIIPDYARDSCKIGTGGDPRKRASATATYRSGFPVVMAIFSGGKFTEALIHRKNAKHRLWLSAGKEHFRLDPIFQWIRGMALKESPLHSLFVS
jgi:hypothetical protein